MRQRGAIRVILAVVVCQVLALFALLSLVNYDSTNAQKGTSNQERRHTLSEGQFNESHDNSVFTFAVLAIGVVALILVTIQCAKKEKPVKISNNQAQSNTPTVTIAAPLSEQKVVNPVPAVAGGLPPLPPPRKSMDGNTPRAMRSDSVADMPDLIDRSESKNKQTFQVSEMEITVHKPDVATEDIKHQAQHDRQGQLSKVCIAWVNKHLNCISEDIKNLNSDLRSGVMMIRLVQILANLRMPQYHANPVNDAQRISNMNQLIKFLYTVGIEINGIQGSDLLGAPENVWTTIILILMQSFKDVKPRPRPPPRTRAPTVDGNSLRTPSARARATSRPPNSPTLTSSASARLGPDPNIESPRAEGPAPTAAKRPPPLPNSRKPALSFKKSPAINNDGTFGSPKPSTPTTAPGNNAQSSKDNTPPTSSNSAKSNDLAAYNEVDVDEKKDLFDDLDLGGIGGDDFDADMYFKKLANDLGLKEIDSSYERVRMSILDFSKKSGGGVGMDRMSMLFANPRMSVLDFKDKDFDNLEQMLLEVAGELDVDFEI